MPKIVDYYFSPVSPWTYLGHLRLVQLLLRHNAQVNVKPVDLAAKIFPVSGGLPLKQRAPQRQAYRLVELKRWREYLDMPLNLEPKFFPAPQDAAVLLIIGADLTAGADAAMQLAFAIMRACWAEERNVADADTLAAIVHERRLDATELAAARDAAQAKYESYTQEAIDRGVFGAPTYVYAGELFWGQDRLDFLNRALGKSA